MTEQEKQLLLIDLYAMVPYDVKISTRIKGNLNFRDSELSGELLDDFVKKDWGIIKPYLRPMSSMTEEEKKEYDKLCDYCLEQDIVDYNIQTLDRTKLIFVIDWLNKKHFDYRGLIPNGLALEAPEGMYK